MLMQDFAGIGTNVSTTQMPSETRKLLADLKLMELDTDQASYARIAKLQGRTKALTVAQRRRNLQNALLTNTVCSIHCSDSAMGLKWL